MPSSLRALLLLTSFLISTVSSLPQTEKRDINDFTLAASGYKGYYENCDPNTFDQTYAPITISLGTVPWAGVPNENYIPSFQIKITGIKGTGAAVYYTTPDCGSWSEPCAVLAAKKTSAGEDYSGCIGPVPGKWFDKEWYVPTDLLPK